MTFTAESYFPQVTLCEFFPFACYKTLFCLFFFIFSFFCHFEASFSCFTCIEYTVYNDMIYYGLSQLDNGFGTLHIWHIMHDITGSWKLFMFNVAFHVSAFYAYIKVNILCSLWNFIWIFMSYHTHLAYLYWQECSKNLLFVGGTGLF